MSRRPRRPRLRPPPALQNRASDNLGGRCKSVFMRYEDGSAGASPYQITHGRATLPPSRACLKADLHHLGGRNRRRALQAA
jgi:hypothetical protein